MSTLNVSLACDPYRSPQDPSDAVASIQMGTDAPVLARIRAPHAQNRFQVVQLRGNWPSPCRLLVTFTNDAWGGTAATDRNLYLLGASLDGKWQGPPSDPEMRSTGDQRYIDFGGAPSPSAAPAPTPAAPPAPAPVQAPAPAPAPAPASGATPFPLGCHVGNPNGSDAGANAVFENFFTQFAAAVAPPVFMNGFTDFANPPSTWPGNAGWTAWSWSKGVAAKCKPVLGVALSDNSHWESSGTGSTNWDFFKAVIAGTYDAAYAGVIKAWADAGYKDLRLRPGYEMNGSFMPWFTTHDPAVMADWVRAFQHVVAVSRGAAAAAGATLKTIWNPSHMNWTPLPVQQCYPGDDSVDIIGVDVYSPVYPRDLYDYSKNDGEMAPNAGAWMQSLVNRQHWWTHPNASQWHQDGEAGTGFSLRDAVAMAVAHGKPLSICECGQGGDGTSNGLVDDPDFVHWLAAELRSAQAQGVAIDSVMVWATTEGDGDWDILTPGKKPLAAAAWKKEFGLPS